MIVLKFCFFSHKLEAICVWSILIGTASFLPSDIWEVVNSKKVQVIRKADLNDKKRFPVFVSDKSKDLPISFRGDEDLVEKVCEISIKSD